jgi:hypothetical protein
MPRPHRGLGACGQRSVLWLGNRDYPGSRQVLCLSVNEIRRLHAIFCRPAHPPGHHLHWSYWRRRHQARARHFHYQRRREKDRTARAI